MVLCRARHKTMGLYIAAALSPEHRATTLAELERLGFEVSVGEGRRRRPRLPTVRRTLILCPPLCAALHKGGYAQHLVMRSWWPHLRKTRGIGGGECT